MSNRTICQIIDETLMLTNDENVIDNLLRIKECATHMEDRLLKYCNSIEDLGFMRIGRNYDKQ